jgi:hypothetical protein
MIKNGCADTLIGYHVVRSAAKHEQHASLIVDHVVTNSDAKHVLHNLSFKDL